MYHPCSGSLQALGHVRTHSHFRLITLGRWFLRLPMTNWKFYRLYNHT